MNISQSASPLKLSLHCWCLCDRSHHTAGPQRRPSFTVLVGVLCLLHTLVCQLISTCDHVMIKRKRRRKRTHLRLQTLCCNISNSFKWFLAVQSESGVLQFTHQHLDVCYSFLFVCFSKGLHWIHQWKNVFGLFQNNLDMKSKHKIGAKGIWKNLVFKRKKNETIKPVVSNQWRAEEDFNQTVCCQTKTMFPPWYGNN